MVFDLMFDRLREWKSLSVLAEPENVLDGHHLGLQKFFSFDIIAVFVAV